MNAEYQLTPCKIKICVVGGAEVGKTSLCQQLATQVLSLQIGSPESRTNNFGASLQMAGTTFDVALNDLTKYGRAVETTAHWRHNVIYLNADSFVVVFSLDDRNSLEEAFTIWIPDIRMFHPYIDIVLCGNKSDLVPSIMRTPTWLHTPPTREEEKAEEKREKVRRKQDKCEEVVILDRPLSEWQRNHYHYFLRPPRLNWLQLRKQERAEMKERARNERLEKLAGYFGVKKDVPSLIELHLDWNRVIFHHLPDCKVGDASAKSVMLDYPFLGVYNYYEVTIVELTRDICIGFTLGDYGEDVRDVLAQNQLPGWTKWSWALHTDDGKLYNDNVGTLIDSSCFDVGDTIGCGIYLDEHDGRNITRVVFTKNGKLMGSPVVIEALADRSVCSDLVAVVGANGDAEVKYNFGIQAPFLYKSIPLYFLEQDTIVIEGPKFLCSHAMSEIWNLVLLPMLEFQSCVALRGVSRYFFILTRAILVSEQSPLRRCISYEEVVNRIRELGDANVRYAETFSLRPKYTNSGEKIQVKNDSLRMVDVVKRSIGLQLD